jgi:hypothetical protein
VPSRSKADKNEKVGGTFDRILLNEAVGVCGGRGKIRRISCRFAWKACIGTAVQASTNLPARAGARPVVAPKGES